MPIKKSGYVQEVQQKVTNTGKTYFRVKVDGTWYSLWTSAAGFEPGKAIEFEEVSKGDFKNMTNPVVVTAAQIPVNSEVGVPSTASPSMDKESRIVRQNAFSTAAAIVSAWYEKEKEKKDLSALLDITEKVARRVFNSNMYGYNYAFEDKGEAQAATPPTPGPNKEDFFG